MKIEYVVFTCDIRQCGREFVPSPVRVLPREAWRQARDEGWQHGIVRPMLGGVVVEPHKNTGELCSLHAPGKTGIILTQDELTRMENERAASAPESPVRRRNVARKPRKVSVAGV